MKVSMNKADFLGSNLTGMAKGEGDYFIKEYTTCSIGRKSYQTANKTTTKKKLRKQTEDQHQKNTEGTIGIMEIEKSIENKNAEE
eukprot:2856715-Ditylum_brightwellii.AAC.1